MLQDMSILAARLNRTAPFAQHVPYIGVAFKYVTQGMCHQLLL